MNAALEKSFRRSCLPQHYKSVILSSIVMHETTNNTEECNPLSGVPPTYKKVFLLAWKEKKHSQRGTVQRMPCSAVCPNSGSAIHPQHSTSGARRTPPFPVVCEIHLQMCLWHTCLLEGCKEKLALQSGTNVSNRPIGRKQKRYDLPIFT